MISSTLFFYLTFVIIIMIGVTFAVYWINTKHRPKNPLQSGMENANLRQEMLEKLNENTIGAYIISSEKVLDWFGYWPSFHDAEIHWIHLNRVNPVSASSVSIEMGLFAYEITSKHRQFLVHRHCLISFRFLNCSDIRLDGFNQQNQCSYINFEIEKQSMEGLSTVPINYVVNASDGEFQVPDKVIRINIVTEFGVEGSFKCFRAEVTNIEACDEEGNRI